MKRVLFDEDVPRPLRRDLPDFEIQTVVEAGWSGITNGELLRRADQLFDAFLTADRNHPFQQNLANLQRMGVVVIATGGTKPQGPAAVRAADHGGAERSRERQVPPHPAGGSILTQATPTP